MILTKRSTIKKANPDLYKWDENIKYRFTEYYVFPEDHSPNDAIARIKDLEERLGLGLMLSYHSNTPLAKWYYKWTKVATNTTQRWILGIYLTTDEQVTYCSLALPQLGQAVQL